MRTWFRSNRLNQSYLSALYLGPAVICASEALTVMMTT